MQSKYLDSLIAAYETKTTIQIAILTVDTSMTTEAAFDEFVMKTMNEWGVGQKIKNNGIVIAFSSAYKPIRIENGSGITKFLSNAEFKKIIDSSFIPHFREYNYYEGVLTGVQVIMDKLVTVKW